jgi:hypothetical protein
MFPLSCAGARPRSNWNAPAHTELLPRSWNVSIFIVNILIMHIKKKLLKYRAVVRSCKNFLLRAAAGPRSCKKKLGPLRPTEIRRSTQTPGRGRLRGGGGGGRHAARVFVVNHRWKRRSCRTLTVDIITVFHNEGSVYRTQKFHNTNGPLRPGSGHDPKLVHSTLLSHNYENFPSPSLRVSSHTIFVFQNWPLSLKFPLPAPHPIFCMHFLFTKQFCMSSKLQSPYSYCPRNILWAE